MHRGTSVTQLNRWAVDGVKRTKKFLFKIAPRSNGNYIRNTLRFLYWLSRGIILYLLRNSSEARDKCKLVRDFFSFFFVKPCTTPTFSPILLLTSFFFIEI
jgi:hypothetical protein